MFYFKGSALVFLFLGFVLSNIWNVSWLFSPRPTDTIGNFLIAYMVTTVYDISELYLYQPIIQCNKTKVLLPHA